MTRPTPPGHCRARCWRCGARPGPAAPTTSSGSGLSGPPTCAAGRWTADTSWPRDVLGVHVRVAHRAVRVTVIEFDEVVRAQVLGGGEPVEHRRDPVHELGPR